MNRDTGLVFINGAGLHGWIWKDVAPLLQLPTLTLEFPGRQKTAVGNDIALEGYADHLSGQIRDWNIPGIILVCHSIGGVVGLRVAASLGAKLAGFIGIGAFIPDRGGSFLSCLPFPQRAIMGVLLRTLGTRPPATAIRKGLCTDLDSETTEKIVNGFVAESRRLYSDPCGSPVPEVPTLYIKTTRDGDMPLSLQEKMGANLKAGKTEVVDTGHLCMLSRPKEVAEAINRFTVGLG